MNDLRVLCVDDEPDVLQLVARNLRHYFRVDTASGGFDALQRIEREEPYAVVVSDMYMPEMNGVEFLRRLRLASPDSVRVLLTGAADATVAAEAVNQGAISKFVSKPYQSGELVATLIECGSIYQRTLLEREVMERTLTSSIQVLSQTVALANPKVFARVARAEAMVRMLSPALEVDDRWSTEVAVPLSQLGAVCLSGESMQRWADGASLSDMADAVLARMRSISLSMARTIPRLERTCSTILHGLVADVPPPNAPLSAVVLWCAFEVDSRESAGASRLDAARAVREQLRGQQRLIFEPMLSATRSPEVRTIPARMLTDGMVLARDVSSEQGVLLVSRGSVVTPALVAHLQTFASRSRLERVQVHEEGERQVQ